jgi:hypothetical protein
MCVNVQTQVSRGNREHITGLNNAMPVLGSLRDVARAGEKTKHSIGDTIEETYVSFPSFSYVRSSFSFG